MSSDGDGVQVCSVEGLRDDMPSIPPTMGVVLHSLLSRVDLVNRPRQGKCVYRRGVLSSARCSLIIEP